MEVILRLINDLRFVLIAICGICCAAFLFAGLGSLRDLRRAVFRLERSAIVSRVFSAWLKAGLCLVVAAVIWALTGVTARSSTPTASANPLAVTPTITISTVEPTAVPTADLSNAPVVMTAAPADDAAVAAAAAAALSTPDPALAAAAVITPAGTEPTAGPGSLPTLAAVPTQAGQPTPAAAVIATPDAAALPTLPPPAVAPTPEAPPTAAPAPPAAAPAADSFFADCPNPDAQIASPGTGETVSGAYNVRGTAGFVVGGKYKMEILRPNIEGWAFLWENFNNVRDGVLMPNFNSGLFPPGVYVLRLMIVDSAGQETGISCRVAIRIAG